MKQELGLQELTVYIGEDDQWHGKPLSYVVIEILQTAHISGVTVFKGVEGYGIHHKLHTANVIMLFEGLPIVIRAIDSPNKVKTALTALDDLLTEALVTVNDVRAFRYGPEQSID
jgi:PII-like signaling protein